MRTETIRSSFTIDTALVSAWAELSGDHNRLHTDPEFAATTRYGRCIAHGPVLASLVGEVLASNAGAGWAKSGDTSFRFAAPVFVPSVIDAVAEVTVDTNGKRHAEVTCTDEAGNVVLTARSTWNGTAE